MAATPMDRDDDTGYGYPEYTDAGYDPGYRGRGSPTGRWTPPDDTGTGYGYPAYDEGRFAADAGGYPDDDDYPAEDDEYPEYREPSAGRRDRDDDHRHPDRRDWYEDVDEQQDWPEDDEDDFVPGLGTAPGTRTRDVPMTAAAPGVTGAPAARARAGRAAAGHA